MRFTRNYAAEELHRKMIPGSTVLQFMCRHGEYSFVIAQVDGGRWVASYKGKVTDQVHYIGDIVPPRKLPAFDTQTEAERACEAQWKKLRN